MNTYYSPCDLSLLKAEDLPDVEEETDADEKLPDGSPVPIEGRKKTKSRKGKKKTGPRKREILLSRMRQFKYLFIDTSRGNYYSIVHNIIMQIFPHRTN